MLITVVGVDSVGKGTQVLALSEILRRWYSVAVLDFPRYKTPTGKIIDAYLKGVYGPMGNLDPYQIADMYISDHAAARHDIEEARRENEVVICNRFWICNLAFNRARLDDETAKSELTNYIVARSVRDAQLPFPDFTILLFTSKKEQWLQMLEGRGGARDQHESNSPFLEAVEREYHFLLPQLRGVSIDIADLTPRAVTARILHSLRPILRQRNEDLGTQPLSAL